MTKEMRSVLVDLFAVIGDIWNKPELQEIHAEVFTKEEREYMDELNQIVWVGKK